MVDGFNELGRDPRFERPFLDCISIAEVEMKASCGFPSPAMDYRVDELDVASYFVREPAATYIVTARGASMINAGILDEIEDIKASLTTHIAESARVLRRKALCTKRLRGYFFTDPFRSDLPSYAADVEREFFEPTDDVLELTTAALDLVDRVFRKGFAYKKAGIILTDLVTLRKRDAERSLFTEPESEQKKERSRKLMATLDGLEKRFGKGTVVPAAELLSSRWRMKQDRKSRCSTTRWDELIETAS